MIQRYLSAVWRDGGRGEIEQGIAYYDCWGLVRAVRHELYGHPLLPSYGHVRRTMPATFSEAQQREAVQLQPCAPRPGAIASVYRGGLCRHVAILVTLEQRLAVLEINPKRNCTWSPLGAWARRHLRVTYHD